MNTQRFPIVGIRHHDFGDDLPSLYATAVGRHVTLSIERDNPLEPNAVIAYLGAKHLGYVRSGRDLIAARNCIASSLRRSLLAHVTEVDSTSRVIWIELEEEIQVSSTIEVENPLENWSYTGMLLPVEEEVVRLNTVADTLLMYLENRIPWGEETEELLQYIMNYGWRDISSQMATLLTHILQLLTDNSHLPLYADAAARLQEAIDRMGSPEVRRFQAARIIEAAHSSQMDTLLIFYQDNAEKAIQSLPQAIVDLFEKDGEMFIGRIFYLHLPFRKIQALTTLLAMSIRVHEKKGNDAGNKLLSTWCSVWDPTQTMTLEQLIPLCKIEHLHLHIETKQAEFHASNMTIDQVKVENYHE